MIYRKKEKSAHSFQSLEGGVIHRDCFSHQFTSAKSRRNETWRTRLGNRLTASTMLQVKYTDATFFLTCDFTELNTQVSVSCIVINGELVLPRVTPLIVTLP